MFMVHYGTHVDRIKLGLEKKKKTFVKDLGFRVKLGFKREMKILLEIKLLINSKINNALNIKNKTKK